MVLIQSRFLQKSMFFRSSFFASKHINFSFTYQPKPHQKKSTFWLIRILSIKIRSVTADIFGGVVVVVLLLLLVTGVWQNSECGTSSQACSVLYIFVWDCVVLILYIIQYLNEIENIWPLIESQNLLSSVVTLRPC